jgi:exosortase E/protease (VPEID-CTERM system)
MAQPAGDHASRLGIPRRLVALAALGAGEMLLASFVFGFPNPYGNWSNPVFYANGMGLVLFLTSLAFVLIAWPRRAQVARLWEAATRHDTGWTRLAVNAALFASLLGARAALAHPGPGGTPSSWFWGYSLLVLATGASLALMLAPASFWRELLRQLRLEIVMAFAAAGLVLAAGALSRESWEALTIATMHLSHMILSLYEPNPFIDAGQRILGAEEFRVQIWAPCSGYEGIGLVTAFLAIYMWMFRAHLRFPNAYCLIPIGIGAIWILNGLRVALLVSIGAHISPKMALEGFHSWSGWMAFIAVTAAIMVASRYSSFIWKGTQARAAPHDDAESRKVVVYLAPFAAFIAARIVASTFAPFEQAFYPLTVVAIGTVLWWFRRDYARLVRHVSWLSVGFGLAVGVGWIATQPQQVAGASLGDWLGGLPVALAAAWLVLRAVGSVVLVPIAEELAFRGYLCRLIETLPQGMRLTSGQMRAVALVVSSVAFGLLHDRYLAAALAGAVYAVLMYRSGRLSDPIAAHMASNGAIVFWSVAAGQWSLL